MTGKAPPTTKELGILGVLWKHGPSTVRQVHEHLDSPAGYTTTLKLMQIMADKALVTRDESLRSHVYSAAVSRDRTQGRLVDQLVDRAFEGSTTQLVVRALSGGVTSPEELAEIRALIDEMESDS